MFRRDGEEIMTFRVFDSVGNCVNEFTGTMSEWQREVAPGLAALDRAHAASSAGALLN
jgi:hypothetical protein